MLEKFIQYFKSEFPDPEKHQFYLAISGGKDSVALSHLLIEAKIKHTLLHCNFNLRGKESEKDEEFVKSHANNFGLDFLIESYDTSAEAINSNTNIQLTARNLRYNWFKSILDENRDNVLLTAHHLDDSIETFFINLLRGTGFKGLSGIPERVDQIYRPLLNFPVSEIYAFIEKSNIVYRIDASNFDDKYTRNKIRLSLIPLIEELSPEFRTKFKALFKEQNHLNTFLRSQIDDVLIPHLRAYGNHQGIAMNILKSTDQLVLNIFFTDMNVNRSKSDEFMKFFESKKGSIFLTSSHEFLNNKDEVLFRLRKTTRTHSKIAIKKSDFPFQFNQFQFDINNSNTANLKTNDPLFIALDNVNFPISIRSWTYSDKIQPFGMSGTKLISDILIDKKLNRFEKEEVLVLQDSKNKILAIPGLMISEIVRVKPVTEQTMSISKFS